MSTYKRAFRLALHALRILYLQIIFALLERSAAVDSGFHAALFVPTLCICKGFIMLHEDGTYGAHFCTSLRARDAMVVWQCTLAKAIEQIGSSCMFHAKNQLVVKLDIPARACALPGDTHAEQVTFQVNMYLFSAVYCH